MSQQIPLSGISEQARATLQADSLKAEFEGFINMTKSERYELLNRVGIFLKQCSSLYEQEITSFAQLEQVRRDQVFKIMNSTEVKDEAID